MRKESILNKRRNICNNCEITFGTYKIDLQFAISFLEERNIPKLTYAHFSFYFNFL